MDPDLKAKLGGQLRLVLGFLSGWAIAHKWIDEVTASRLVELGILLVPLGVGVWSWWQKTHQEKVVAVALTLPASTTKPELEAAVAASEIKP